MLRYDSYKDSGVDWIGEIPSHWERQKLKYCGELICGGTPSTNKEEYWNGNIPWIQSGKIHFKNITPQDVDKYITELGFENSSTKMVKKNSPVLAITGATCSNVGFLTFNSTVNQSVIGIHVNKINLPRFIYYYLISQKKQVLYHQSGGAQGGVSKGVVENLDIVKVNFEEQQQIVSFLDTKTSLIDSLIEKTKRKIELLKEKRTSLINEVVTKGLNPDVEMNDSGVEWIGEIPSHWVKTKLHTLVTSQKLEFQDGNHGGLHPLPEEFLEEGVPFIKPKDIQNEKVLWDTCDRLPIERCEQFRIGFSNNDDVLLVNRGGSIGKVVYVSDYNKQFPYFIINPQVTYMRGKNGIVSRYLFYVSISDIFQCGIHLILGHGSTFPFLGLSNMGNFEMVYPNEKEQNEIVSYLDEQTQKIDKTISLEEKRIELLEEYRQSLISEVVTGKRKVVE